jgi:hypothetical protein
MMFFAPTEVAKAFLFGNDIFGETTLRFLKLKFFNALAHAPIFSGNCGLYNMK